MAQIPVATVELPVPYFVSADEEMWKLRVSVGEGREEKDESPGLHRGFLFRGG